MSAIKGTNFPYSPDSSNTLPGKQPSYKKNNVPVCAEVLRSLKFPKVNLNVSTKSEIKKKKH